MEEKVLIHWGIKGQKWGRRRFQNKDGSLTPAGKERYDKDDDSDEKIESPDERKARILKSGSAAEVMRYQGQLSNKELNDAAQRIRLENELNKVAAEQKTRGVDKFNQIMNDVDKIRGGVEKGLNAWNLLAKINNTFSENQLPEINGKYFKSDALKKKADEAEAKAKKDREEALRNVTPEEAAKNADKYTTAELQDLNKRYAALDGINSKVKKNSSNDGDDNNSSNKGENSKPKNKPDDDSKPKNNNDDVSKTDDEGHAIGIKGQKWGVRKTVETEQKQQEEAAAKTRSDALKSLISKSRAERTETKVTSLKDVKDKDTNTSITNLSDDAIKSAIARAKAGNGTSRDKDILAKYGNVVVTDVRRASGTTAAKRDAMSNRIANAMANADKKKKKNK